MSGKGEALNKRVWELFSNLGFETKPNWNDPQEETITLSTGRKRTVDLLAIDKELGVKIIGWNKSGDIPGSFSTHVHDYEKLKERINANGLLFVATGVDISDDDRSLVENAGGQIWTNDELKYYEVLVETVGRFAKYEVIHALGITTKEERHLVNALALHIHQPFSDSQSDLFLFTASPEFLLKTSVVLRKAAGNKDAYQRVIHGKRLLQIKKFLSKEDSLLPPNIIVHLSDDVISSPIALPTRDKSNKPINLAKPDNYELVSLGIPTKYASLEIIDGQHRLFGFAHVESEIRKKFNLIVVGIANLTSKRRTETFVSINDNARRMDPNLVSYLRYDSNETTCQNHHDLMAIKVVVELNKTSPFKRKIRLLDTGNQRITLKGFSGYDLRGLLGPRGELRKNYPNNWSEEYVNALRMYFNTLKSLFPKQWKDPDKYIIFTNRGISAFLKLLKSILRTTQSPLTHTTIKKYLTPVQKEWSDKQWQTTELKNSFVGSQGWKDFHRALVKTIKKHHGEFKD